MLALMRYGAGLPMYRMDQWQTYLGVPLAASTQWELIKASSRTPELVYEALIVWGAQGQIIYSDDTTMRVQSLRREIVAEPEDTQRRTGIFTTSIVVRIGQNQIALFFTGRNHAGENLDRLLKNRAAELPAPIHMCDALSRNQPQGVKTISCNCLLHGRRNFLEVLESFPQECKKVVLSLREVYRWEALAKKRQFSDEERLAFHQAHSGPVMQELQQWMNDQLEQKKVQPNSGLGEAIRYMTKHWKSLTRFLEVPGAPLDNIHGVINNAA
ncbi:MAG: transposase [Candidatus Omnitrophica bacterium]|nr:transposase [Candidatus Omnitrophota bacterium]